MRPAFVSFIMPTKGRDTIGRALESLKRQTESDWNLMVIGDQLPEVNEATRSIGRLEMNHKPIEFFNCSEKLGHDNCAGLLRNIGIERSTSEWIAFIDDDDRLNTQYVEWLKEDIEGADAILYRMQYPDGHVTPNRGDNSLRACQVGISFAVRRSFVQARGILFDASTMEDWRYMEQIINHSGRVKVSDLVAYYVRN